MLLFVIGFNHDSANISLRERLALSDCSQRQISVELLANMLTGVMILSTCNRLELICTGKYPQQVLAYLSQYTAVPLQQLQQHSYIKESQEAYRHIVRVAAGLDSMVLGETQIFGQMKKAYDAAKQGSSLGKDLTQLIPYIFSQTKDIRSKTGISDSPISLAYAVLGLAKSVFSLPGKKILVIGAGEIADKVLAHFSNQNVTVYLANRGHERAVAVASKYNAIVVPRLADIELYLATVDVVITAVSTSTPILSKSLVSKVKATRNSQMLFVDLGLPRNIEPEIRDVAGVYLYDLDNMQLIIKQGLQERSISAEHAEKLLEEKIVNGYRHFESLAGINIVRDFRGQVSSMREQILASSLAEIESGKDGAEVLAKALHQLTNKILHSPTVQLRRAVLAKRGDLVALTKDFFNL